MATPVERIRRAGGALALTAAASLALAAVASAQDAPPSAVNQYVEMVPAAEGPQTPAAGKRKPKPAPLPEAGREALEEAAPETAAALEEVATSASYGAPAAPTKPKPTATPRKRPVQPEGTREVTDTALQSAGAVATASVSDTRLVALLIAISLTTLGSVALAIRRARAERP